MVPQFGVAYRRGALPTVAAAAVSLGTAAFGAIVALNFKATLAGLVAVATIIALATIPISRMGLVVGIAAIVVPSLILESKTVGLSVAASALSGQARILMGVAFVCFARVAVARTPLAPPGLAGRPVAVYSGFLVVSVAVAFAQGNDYPELWSDLSRQLSYPLAFLIGIAIARGSTSESDRLRVYRGLAGLALVAGLGSVAYWAWTNGFPPPPLLGGTFETVRALSPYEAHRAVFPFVQDSPNLGALAFVILASFTCPLLMSSGHRRDRNLAVAVASCTIAAVLTTQSRTGLLALVAAPWPFVLADGGALRKRRLALAAIVAAGVLAGTYQFFPHGRRLSTDASTLVSRQELWSQARQRFLDRPVLGEGYHYSARSNFKEEITTPRADGLGGSDQLKSVHNEYLGEIVDGGVVGGAIFLYLLSAFTRTSRALRRLPDAGRSEGIALLCMSFALAVGMAANSAFQSAAVMTFIWLFLGIAAGRLPVRSAP